MQLVEDKPEIILSNPPKGLTEEGKLYGAFCAYADFHLKGYGIMNQHYGDIEIGQKIVNRLKKSNFSGNMLYIITACNYILGVSRYGEVKVQFGDNLSAETLNGPFKRVVIQKAKERYGLV